MKITICDDVKTDIDTLSFLCKRYAKRNALEIEIREVTNPMDLCLDDTDVLFLDIEMPEKNGIEIQRERELISGRPLIVFVTNHSVYSMCSHGTNVIGFLSKPVPEGLLGEYLEKALTLLYSNRIISFGPDYRYSSRQIEYIMTDFGCCKAVLKGGTKSVGVYKSMTEWERELGPHWFIRVSQSYLVNCQHIESLTVEKVILKSGECLKMSRRAYRTCKQRYMEYLEKMARFA